MNNAVGISPKESKIQGLLGSHIFHLSCLLVLSICISLLYGIERQPLLRDRSYHVYMGQVIHRGNLLYGSTVYGYTPYGPMLTAGIMFVGDLFEIPTYISPRFGAIFVTAVNCCMVYLLILHTTSRKFQALVGGLVSGGFGFISMLAVSDLEPKLLVTSFMLVAMLMLQMRKWTLLGAACGAGVMFWQPAVIVAGVMFIVVAVCDPSGWRSRIAKFIAGVFVAVLPAIIYLTLTHEWNDFFIQTVVAKADENLTIKVRPVFKWVLGCFGYFWSEAGVLLLGTIALFRYILTFLTRSKNSILRETFNPSNGAGFLLTISWPVFLAVDYDPVSLIPLVMLLSIWSTEIIIEGVDFIWRKMESRRIPSHFPSLQKVRIAALAVLAIYLYSDALFYRPPFTLKDQLEMVHSLIGSKPETGAFLAVNAEETYVLTDIQSPIRYNRIESGRDRLIALTELGSTEGFIKRLGASLPDLVITREEGGMRGKTLLKINNELLLDYDLAVIKIPCVHFLYHTLPQMLFISHQHCGIDLMVYRRMGKKGIDEISLSGR